MPCWASSIGSRRAQVGQTESVDTDLASLMLRLTLGVVFILHGWNHGFGPGGLAGTTSWFQGLGLRPARLQAAVSTYLELAAGVALVVGLATPLAAAAGIGVMVTAFVTVHRANGFFIFRDGYEYVLVVAVALAAVAVLGGGGWSLDAALEVDDDLAGAAVGAAAVAAGVLGSLGMLAVCWRPPQPTDAETGSA